MSGERGEGGERPAAVPLTIISGFLGAGKTTTINHVLNRSEGRRKTGLLVNDFAEVNIDAQLLRSTIQSASGGAAGDKEKEKEEEEQRLIELSNGCVCCSISGELQHSIEKVLALGVEHILVETSGVSDPSNIVQTLLLPQLRALVWLCGIVVVVDGESVLATLDQSFSSRNQLRQADVVVLNKTDLLSSDQYESTKAAIRKHFPDVHVNIIPSQFGSIPESVIFGEAGEQPEGRERESESERGSASAAPQAQPHSLWRAMSTAGGQAGGHRDELGGLATVSYSREGATFSLARFQAFMARHFPQSVIRAKGFLYFDCAPECCYTLQLSGRRRFDASDCRRPPQEQQHRVDFVFIGTGLDRGEITRRMDACRSDAAAPEGPSSPPAGDGGGAGEEALALAELIGKDMRFEVGTRVAALPALVFFRLKPTRWHGMTTADMNRSLLSTFNARSDRSRLFLTHTTSHEGDADGFMLRFDMSAAAGAAGETGETQEEEEVGAAPSAREVWLSIQQATEAMLTSVFMNIFCCG